VGDKVVVRVNDHLGLPVGETEGLGLIESLSLPGECDGLFVNRTEAVKEALLEVVRLRVRLRLTGLWVAVGVRVWVAVKVAVFTDGVTVEHVGVGDVEKVKVVDMAKVWVAVRVNDAVPVSDTS